MKFNEFVNTYYGKAIDYDGGYGVQCVDLIKLYADKVFNLKFGAFGNAHAYYDNYTKIPMLYENFTRIANTPDFVPQKGDIVVWNTKRSNGNGHIAIATGVGDTKSFHSYDTNWDGKGGAMKDILHDYTNVSGVLRYNKGIEESSVNSNFKAGDRVLVDIPIKIAYRGSNNPQDNSIVDSNGYQFWVSNTVIKDDNKVYGLGDICYAQGDGLYIVQIFDKQFWCREQYLSKKF